MVRTAMRTLPGFEPPNWPGCLPCSAFAARNPGADYWTPPASWMLTTDDQDPVHLCEYCVSDVRAVLSRPSRPLDYPVTADDMGVYYVARSEDGYNYSIAPGATLSALQAVMVTPKP